MTRRKTQNQFISEMNEKRPDLIVVGEYINTDTPVAVKCKICGHIWETATPHALLKGISKCEKCLPKGLQRQNKYKERFEDTIDVLRPDITVLGEYKGSKTHILVECKTCGCRWNSSTPKELVKGGSRCPKCYPSTRKKSRESFIEELNNNRDDIVVIGDYKNTHTLIEVECKVCGHRWSAVPHDLKIGIGQCEMCLRNRVEAGVGSLAELGLKRTHEEFVEELSRKNPNVEILGEYTRALDKVKTRCKVCNHTWKAIPQELLNKHGCPSCSRTQTSYVEKYIYYSFVNALGEEQVVSRSRDLIGKEIDILIPKMNLAFEPGSWFWHKDKVAGDLEKRKECNKKGVRLITIYDSYSEDTPINDEDVICIKQNLGYSGEEGRLKDLVFMLFDLAELDINTIDFQRISEQAYKASRRRNTEGFIEEISNINSDIIILGNYKGTGEKIECKCRICGYEWNPVASSLLRGAGCRKCWNKKMAINQQKKVRCIETGIIYDSIKAAANSVGLKRSTSIRVSCQKKGATGAGYHWEYVD